MMEIVSRAAFGAASGALMLLALALVVYGGLDLAVSLSRSGSAGGDAVLTAIGYVVIALAVFDVAKYFVEEEVIRNREMRLASEARRSLTKFISTIAIAVFIEGVVIVFQVSKQNVEQILYPTALLVTAILIVLGLGAYQRMSADAEHRIEQKDRAEQGRGKRG